MRSDNITLGRKTPGVNVDVDLTLEGPAWKISRRQVRKVSLNIIMSFEMNAFVLL